MSHVSTYGKKITNVKFFCEKAKELGYEVVQGDLTVRLFTNPVKCIASIKVKGWISPLAIKENGEILYDHFGSKPGSMENFHHLLDTYNQDTIMQNLPMDMIQNYYIEEVEDGRKLVLEFE